MRVLRKFALVVILCGSLVGMLSGCGTQSDVKGLDSNMASDEESSGLNVESPSDRSEENNGSDNMEQNENQEKIERTDTIVDDSTKVDGEGTTDTTDVEGDIAIVLDPGHGGGYTGAVSGELVEKELTLKLSNYVKEYLEENYAGIQVFLTREEDIVFSGDIVEDLTMRAEFALEKEADALVSLHLNASEGHDQSGCMVFVTKQPELNETSTKLAESIINYLTEHGIENGGVRTRDSNDLMDDEGEPLDYYAINRHCASRGIPGIIVEHCYIDSETDRKFIENNDALKELAEADAKGIAEYFGL